MDDNGRATDEADGWWDGFDAAITCRGTLPRARGGIDVGTETSEHLAVSGLVGTVAVRAGRRRARSSVPLREDAAHHRGHPNITNEMTMLSAGFTKSLFFDTLYALLVR